MLLKTERKCVHVVVERACHQADYNCVDAGLFALCSLLPCTPCAPVQIYLVFELCYGGELFDSIADPGFSFT